VLSQAAFIKDITTPRVLFISHDGTDYQNMALYHGLRSYLGGRMSFLPGRSINGQPSRRMTALYAGTIGLFQDPKGRGFTYQGRLSTPRIYDDCDDQAALDVLLWRRISDNYFNILIITTFGNSCCQLFDCFDIHLVRIITEYISTNPHAAVITIDGNDIMGCHTDFRDQLPRVDAHFIREADHDPLPHPDWPIEFKHKTDELRRFTTSADLHSPLCEFE
jgi:hypothetical protein